MRESISKHERVPLPDEHMLRRAGLHGPPWRGVKPRPTYPTRARSRPCLAAVLLTAAPASALACPVCGLVGVSDNTWAYQAMSAMLTLLPLAMIGATVWWLARLVARADTERQSATQHIADRAPVRGAETYSVVDSRASGPAKAGHYVQN